MREPNTSSSKSFQQLAQELGLAVVDEIADWYLQRNDTIPDPTREYFDEGNPTGAHPALLLDTSIADSDPPNTIYGLWLRSAHCSSSLRHARHEHPSGRTCHLNLKGWMVVHGTYPIFKKDLVNLFCNEPTNSPFVTRLRHLAAEMEQWW